MLRVSRAPRRDREEALRNRICRPPALRAMATSDFIVFTARNENFYFFKGTKEEMTAHVLDLDRDARHDEELDDVRKVAVLDGIREHCASVENLVRVGAAVEEPAHVRGVAHADGAEEVHVGARTAVEGCPTRSSAGFRWAHYGSLKIYLRPNHCSNFYPEDVTLLFSRFCVFLVLGVFCVHVGKALNCGIFAFFGNQMASP